MNICLIVISVYVIGCLITYFIVCYNKAKRDAKGDFKVSTDAKGDFKVSTDAKGETDPNDFIIGPFWPFLLINVIVTAPFRLVGYLAVKLKGGLNPTKMDADELTNNITNRYEY